MLMVTVKAVRTARFESQSESLELEHPLDGRPWKTILKLSCSERIVRKPLLTCNISQFTRAKLPHSSQNQLEWATHPIR
jgi:hypothetical protein